MATIDNLFPGDLNAGSTISKKVKSWSSTTNPVYAARDMLAKDYTEKTIPDGALFANVVCLKVLNSMATDKPDSSDFKGAFNKLKEVVYGQEATAPIEIVCLHPMLDAHLPKIYKLPNEAGHGGDEAIKGYPIYQGIPGAAVPKPGYVVRVRIDDPLGTDGRWYLGFDETNIVTVKSAEDAPKLKFEDRCKGDFCGEPMSGEFLDYLNEALEWGTGQHVVKPSIDVTSDQGAIPRGKGVFTGYPDISTHPLKQAQDVNLSWICFTGYSQDRVDSSADGIANTEKMKKLVQEYQYNGIRTYVLGYPIHGREQDFIDKIIELADAAKTIGIVIDLGQYVPPGSSLTSLKIRNDILSLYNNTFNAAKEAGYSVGITISNILNHGNIPWSHIAHSEWRPDFFIPQILAQSAKNEGSDTFLTPENPESQTRKAEFTKIFDIFVKLGFKNIIPGLGMLGARPDPEGWSNYALNDGVINKPPLASRQEIKWTFESSLENPNAIIWYDWENINYHSNKWPEKRWDLIKELGDAEAIAEKFNSTPEIDVANKTMILQNPVETYLSDVVQEFKNFINKNKEHINKANSFIPNKAIWEARDPYAVYPKLDAEGKKELEEDIQDKLKQLKSNEETIQEHTKNLNAMGPALSDLGFKKLYKCLGKTIEIDESFAATQSKIDAAKEALRQAQEYHEELQAKLVELQQILEHQNEEEGPKEKKESGKCVEEKVPDANPNTGESYSGIKNGGQKRKASWPKKLDDVDWDRFETGGDGEWLIKKWNKKGKTRENQNAYFSTTPSPLNTGNPSKERKDAGDKGPWTPSEANKRYTIMTWAAADIMERYWQMVFAPFPNISNVRLKIMSSWRPHLSGTSRHYHAGAMDYHVFYYDNGEKKAVPQLYMWAINWYLMNGAKRIPKGCAGLYLNQNIPGVPGYTEESSKDRGGAAHMGVTGLSFDQQGHPVKGNGGFISPGGQGGGPHYDFRGEGGLPGSATDYYIFINSHASNDVSDIGYSFKKAKNKFQLKGWNYTTVSMDFLKKYNPEVHSFLEDYLKNSKQPPQFPGWPYTLIPANEKIPNWNQILGREDWTEEDDEPLVADAGTN